MRDVEDAVPYKISVIITKSMGAVPGARIIVLLFNRNYPAECILDLAPLDTGHCIIEHL